VVHATGFGVNSEGYIEQNSGFPVRNLHGTIVALIIRHLCSDVEFVSMNILDENLKTDGRILTFSLRHVFDYKPDIIHMSLGTMKKRYILSLKRIVNQAKKLNVPIVSAAENSGRVSYPAYLKDVIGVKAGEFENCMQYSYKNSFFYAPFGTEGIESIQKIPDMRKVRGTSMSAAYISGHLAVMLKNNNNLSFREAKMALLKKYEKEE